MDTREGDQVGLELCQIDVEGTAKPERGCDRGHDLCDQPVQVSETGLGNAQILLANIENGLVIHLWENVSPRSKRIRRKKINDGWDDDETNVTDHEGTVRVLEGRMGRQDRIVRFDDRTGQPRSRIHAKFQFGLLAIVR